jgi:hypothetical protein
MDLKKLTASVFVSAALVINVAGNVSFAQPAKEFQPEVGQAGKDVVWVPVTPGNEPWNNSVDRPGFDSTGGHADLAA